MTVQGTWSNWLGIAQTFEISFLEIKWNIVRIWMKTFASQTTAFSTKTMPQVAQDRQQFAMRMAEEAGTFVTESHGC